MARDAKTDPQAGDLLILQDGRYRRVVDRKGNDIYYHMGTGWGNPAKFMENPKRKCCWITSWMDWCRQADIIEVTTFDKNRPIDRRYRDNT
jgi:hypothetical protein